MTPGGLNLRLLSDATVSVECSWPFTLGVMLPLEAVFWVLRGSLLSDGFFACEVVVGRCAGLIGDESTTDSSDSIVNSLLIFGFGCISKVSSLSIC